MIKAEGKTIGAAFEAAVERYPDNLFWMVPSDLERPYYPLGYQITYREAFEQVRRIMGLLDAAGY